MTDRTAVDTIKGYFYQFDASILNLLELTNPTDTIDIECIEDLDIRTADETTAIQYKYYEKTEYNHSVIKDAVMYMVTHFSEVKAGTKERISYIIRGHYLSGQEKLSTGIDVEFLKKNFLTYTTGGIKHCHHDELGLNDGDLGDFLGLLKIDINALAFDVQFKRIIDMLKGHFNCSDFTAEFFYYNHALRIIKELSVSKNASERTISKGAFLERIDISDVLLNEWFIKKKGKRGHFAALRKEYFTELNVSPFERFFLIEVNPESYVRSELKELILIIARKWSKISARGPDSFCPYLVIQGIIEDELANIKGELIREGIKCIDGFDYQGANFNPFSISQQATSGNGVRMKILNSLPDLEATLNTVAKTRKIFQFHLKGAYFEYQNPSVSHARIQVEQISDIKEII